MERWEFSLEIRICARCLLKQVLCGFVCLLINGQQFSDNIIFIVQGKLLQFRQYKLRWQTDSANLLTLPYNSFSCLSLILSYLPQIREWVFSATGLSPCSNWSA